MKRVSHLLLAILLIVSLCGCNSKKDPGDTSAVYNNSSEDEQNIVENEEEYTQEKIIRPSNKEILADISGDNQTLELLLVNMQRGSEFSLVDMANEKNCGEITFYLEANDANTYTVLVKNIQINRQPLEQMSNFTVTDGKGYFTLYWNINPDSEKEVAIDSFILSIDIMSDDVVKYSKTFDISKVPYGGEVITLGA